MGPIEEVLGPLSSLEGIVKEAMIDHLVEAFHLKKDYLSVSEMFVAKYEYGPDKQSSLKAHQDGTLFSFILTLNEPDVDFFGGGTRFLEEAPRKHSQSKEEGGGGGGGGGVVYRPTEVGTGIVFCGKQLHEGVSVTGGVRYILTGFCEYNNCDRVGSHESFLEDYDPRWDGILILQNL